MQHKSASMQQVVAEEVNKRLAKASQELEERYAAGNVSTDVSVDGPTGAAYKEKYLEEQKARREVAKLRNAESNDESNQTKLSCDDDAGDDEDNDLRSLREQRLKQIKDQHQRTLEDLGKGHGQYRDILQDEFLKEVTSSTRVICHFYHRDFSRCAIMDHHLQRLSQRHVETKFIKIDAEKAPFFVEKLAIRTMPTLVLFIDGIAASKVLGFQELAEQMPAGKADEWPTILLARLLAERSIISSDSVVDDDDVERNMKVRADEMRKNAYLNAMSFDPNELSGDDDDE